MVLGAARRAGLLDGRIEGEDPLAGFSPTAAQHLLRTDGFPHVADIMVGSFYDPELDEGCAFEELISFHGGLGGPQTRPFVLYPPARLPAPGRAARRRRGRACAAGGVARGAAARDRRARGRALGARGPEAWRRPDEHAAPAPPRRCARGRRRPPAAQVLVLLVVAALVGLVVSFAAWGFLELLHQIQVGTYQKLPERLGYDHGAPVWWPLPVLALAGLVTALAIVRLPGIGGHKPVGGPQDRPSRSRSSCPASCWRRWRPSASASCSVPRRRSSRSARGSASSPCACCAGTRPTRSWRSSRRRAASPRSPSSSARRSSGR